MRRLSLSHLTVLEVGPPDLITLAADAGSASVGIRLNSPMPGGIAYPLQDGGDLAETRRRMADRGVEVLDVEVVRLGPETLVASYAADVPVCLALVVCAVGTCPACLRGGQGPVAGVGQQPSGFRVPHRSR